MVRDTGLGFAEISQNQTMQTDYAALGASGKFKSVYAVRWKVKDRLIRAVPALTVDPALRFSALNNKDLGQLLMAMWTNLPGMYSCPVDNALDMGQIRKTAHFPE